MLISFAIQVDGAGFCRWKEAATTTFFGHAMKTTTSQNPKLTCGNRIPSVRFSKSQKSGADPGRRKSELVKGSTRSCARKIERADVVGFLTKREGPIMGGFMRVSRIVAAQGVGKPVRVDIGEPLTTASHAWIAANLNMGTADSVSHYLHLVRAGTLKITEIRVRPRVPAPASAKD
jgi:hypothetical protein